MKILITEQQLSRLIENIINENNDLDIFNDPKALVLVNFLNENTDEEYGLMDITIGDQFKGFNIYEIETPTEITYRDKNGFLVVSDEEIKHIKDSQEWEDFYIDEYDGYNIIHDGSVV